MCSDGIRIAAHRQCDGVANCADGQDEQDCLHTGGICSKLSQFTSNTRKEYFSVLFIYKDCEL